MLRPMFNACVFLGLGISYAVAQEYDYVVVGSGPGGAPLAVDLAKAGNSVLLLEAGSDRTGKNIDIDFPIQEVNNPASRWDFFVKHSDDTERELRYKYMTWRRENGTFYVGLDPPDGAEQLGIWYPRAAALGGGAVHGDAVLELPPDAIWDSIAQTTGDKSWAASEMRKIFEEIENAHYVSKGTPGHGFSGWLETNRGYGSWIGNDKDATVVLRATLEELGSPGNNMSVEELRNVVNRDINALDPNRDQDTGVFGRVTHTDSSRSRFTPAEYIRKVLTENPELPLVVELDATVTDIVWDPLSGAGSPSVMAVNYVVGPSAYKADPRYDPNRNTTSKSTYVGKELIIAGGVFTSPQILKVSGIGPAEELKKHNITVVADVPGVGANLGDIYQGSVIYHPKNENADVPGIYSVQLKTSVAENGRDVVMWPARSAIDGYWPGFPGGLQWSPITFQFALRDTHSSQGTVTLRSADPLEPPEINFRFFAESEEQDLQAMYETVEFIENMKDRLTNSSGLIPFEEVVPCPASEAPCTEARIKETLKTQVYSRHATGTCAIGDFASDPLAVLDSKFRVRGVNRLRVVDASVFPRAPGAFPVLSTFMISRKAAKAILEGVDE